MAWLRKLTPEEHDVWTIDRWLASETYPAWAHRGAPNGHERAEFSFDAYDNALAVGMHALEVSVQRSSDGVWVCNHNPATGEQYTTDTVIASTPWATLKTYTRRYGATSEPMRRFEEVLERYDRYTLFIENKTYASFASFFALLNDQPRAVERFVFKAAGDSQGPFNLAKSYGYRGWAYYFGTAGASTLPTEWIPSMDWVGLSSGPTNEATAQEWFDWCATRSIPLYAHIGRVAADWTSAKAQGALGYTINNPAMYPLT